MKRDKRTVYLLPDLSRRVDEAAALGGISPNTIIETALDEHFARESVFGAVEALTRRVGALDERLGEMDRAVKAIGKGVSALVKAGRPEPSPEPVPPAAEPARAVPEPDPAEPARAGGFSGLWGRR